MRLLFVVGLLCLVGLGYSQDSGAKLLASKNILNEWLVEGRDLTIRYSIYNVGSSAAINVALADETFHDSDFRVVSGQTRVQWDRIAPASNVTHTIILQPMKPGYFNFSSATVAYQPSEDAEVVIGYTSFPGEEGIVPFKDFDRKFSPHYVDWGAFAVMILPSIGIPFLLWYRSKSKYENAVLAAKNKKH
ncbi:translocon-associated protein subunit beta-like [Acanthaster planci]|uniref:Translocon-associated protein subunit beta n=1 Tax=Acanthaster planci TaxID=133434 RepID=A0A8B7ZCC6_ACAPL|nr:translocon-associated protein subunit beta-like [Acanthaster planci]